MRVSLPELKVIFLPIYSEAVEGDEGDGPLNPHWHLRPFVHV